MEKDLISIIVPVYNVKKYLCRCIDSLLNQTYKNIEIVLIDASDDGSGKICDEYKKKDNRIIVIHQQNKGVSVARNTGLDICSGNYISFVDSDDYVHYDFISVLYFTLINNKTSLSICSYLIVDNDTNKIEPRLSLNDGKVKSVSYLKNTLSYVVWNKMFKRELFNKYRFPKGKVSEDALISFALVCDAQYVALSSKHLYYYCPNNLSITKVRSPKFYLDTFESREHIIEFIIDNNIESAVLNQCFVDTFIWFILCIQIFKEKKYIKQKKEIKTRFINIKKISLKKLNFKNKIKAKFPNIINNKFYNALTLLFKDVFKDIWRLFKSIILKNP